MPRYVEKVCPVLLRRQDSRLQILAFHHPSAGTQLVKGNVEPGERPEAAVLRELAEESGIEQVRVVRKLGELRFGDVRQHWHIYLCQPAAALPDQWSFFTADGGGQLFEFFWHDLDAAPDESWYPIFRRALALIRTWCAGREA